MNFPTKYPEIFTKGVQKYAIKYLEFKSSIGWFLKAIIYFIAYF